LVHFADAIGLHITHSAGPAWRHLAKVLAIMARYATEPYRA
jgi:hypothetical protein